MWPVINYMCLLVAYADYQQYLIQKEIITDFEEYENKREVALGSMNCIYLFTFAERENKLDTEQKNISQKVNSKSGL